MSITDLPPCNPNLQAALLGQTARIFIKRYARQVCPTALQLGETGAASVRSEIETSAHDTLGLFDIGEGRPQPGHLRCERDLASAEIEIIIFDETGEEIGEGIFAADTDAEPRPGLARRISRTEDNRGRPIIVALPGAASFDVAEETLPGIADAAGDARERFDFAVIGNADLARTVVAAFGVRPGIVALG